MIDGICEFLTKRIRKEMPEIDDEKAEVIYFGLQNIVGEIPKIFVVFGVAWILGIFNLTLYTFLLMYPYRAFSGGFHLKTHLGCLIGTTLYYCGVAAISKYVVLAEAARYILTAIVWLFGMWMIKLYAPADTENVPILKQSVRKKKQIGSYISLTIGLILAVCIPLNEISNVLILGNFIQTLCITKFAYKISNNKYGYEVYGNT